jgi:hypothetical protein
VGRVLDLKPLAFRLRQTLVIRDFGNQVRDRPAKLALQLLARGFRVLNRVVEESSENGEGVLPLGGLGDAARYVGKVVDVGLGGASLAALVSMLVGGEVQGARINSTTARLMRGGGRFKVPPAGAGGSRDRPASWAWGSGSS